MFLPRIVACVLMSVLAGAAHAQQEPMNASDSPETALPQNDPNEQLFKKLFAKRRGEHLEAVRGLRKMDSYERQYKMITVLAEKVFYVIQTSRAVLESTSFDPGNKSFPEDANVRDALSSILENTALFGDIILHLPDITHRILNAQQKWDTMMQWSLNFVNQTRHLLDKSTLTMIHLVGQELNITAREPGYFNPYWSNAADSKTDDEDLPKKKKKAAPKEKRKKGPRITKIEL